MEVESAILQRRASVRYGREAPVDELELSAARTACVVLDDALDFLDGELPRLAARVGGDEAPLIIALRELGGTDEDSALHAAPHASFQELEVALLRLAGLAEELADQHVRNAFEAFRLHEQDWTRDLSEGCGYVEAVMTRLERGRDAVCNYADQLGRQGEAAVRSAGSRRRMRQVATVLGGTLIVGANTAAELFLGPGAAAASIVLGSAATDVMKIALPGAVD